MTEMEKLAAILVANNIPFQTCNCWGTPQICYPNSEHRVCDAICHSGSYGGSKGLLEIMGLVPEEVGDTVEGYLTAENVAERIIKHYNG